MNSLRDAAKKAAPNRQQFRRLMQAVETNLGLESAEDMSYAEVLDIIEDLMDLVPDFRVRWSCTERCHGRRELTIRS